MADQPGAVARRPGATYRLQLHREFGFAAAAGLAGYLAALGVTHVYLSPILQAAPGSMHGYDVVDHSRVCDDLGGEDGFRAMVAAFRRHGLGVVVDVVPNHMGIGAPESLNHQFWSVLAGGQGSRYAHWFDIDWAARGGRLLLPVLGGPVAECASDLAVDELGEQRVLRYFEHQLPLAPGTADLPLDELLAAQHYELADWHTAATELNWRRFFDITTLIGVQVQDPDVFAATHHVLLRLYHDGLIDGLRIDHPDGLADPRGYLRRLAEATGGGWVVTEKILSGDEELPADWDCAGTTGYDALGRIGGVFTDPAGAAPLTAEYVRFTGGPDEFGPVAEAAKREIAYGPLAAEISRLARVAARTGDPVLAAASTDELRAVLAELVCAVPIYRAYVVPGEPPSAASAAVLTAAAGRARGQLPWPLGPVLDAVLAVLLAPGSSVAARAELAVRFQQTCGPVMAKGVEDTAFYRWSRLTALNEVGGEPGRLGLGPAGFHAFAARLAADWPATMTTLSTHDTKRGEDLRARLSVLAERPDEWAAAVADWHERARAPGPSPEPDTEYLLWQTLAGAWPIEPGRLTEYLYKAMREAKTRTSWTDQDTDYEESVTGLARAVLADQGLAGSIADFVARIEPDARVNSLGAKLVQLTMTGVPDVYQGCELGSYSLVDPDNRRPVDFARRMDLLATLDGASPPAGLDGDKLLVTSRALRLRRDHPGWFAGPYEPLAASGPAAEHVLAFARGAAVTVATRLPAGLRRRGGWSGTTLDRPSPPSGTDAWRDVLTGAVHSGLPLSLAQLTARFPVALLVPA
ncbi:MAG TPA: malto-oligosyltrehalose synthase [Streptosporangiaceae bacterium]|nr:malto-oligosyltrehalose synthase [Streptosporangiaceae bacterium]